jgi:hypothetical protein
LLEQGDAISHPASTIVVVHDEEDKDVDFGDFDDDDDVPSLLDAIIDHDDDDESIDSMPKLLPRIQIDLGDDESIDSIDDILAEEDGLIVDDDHIIDDDLEAPDEHAAKWQAYILRKAADIGKSFKIEHKKSKTTWKWTLVEDHIPDKSSIEFENVGLRGFDFENLSDTPAADVFFELWPGDPKQHLRNLNLWVQKLNANISDRRKMIKEVTHREYHYFLAILLYGCGFDESGKDLWGVKNDYPSVYGSPNLKNFTSMSFDRFKAIKSFYHLCFVDPSTVDKSDPWWEIRFMVNAFNKNRNTKVAASVYKVMDESMSSFRPQTSKTGNLPHISYIMRKPKPLGTEFKNMVCGATRMMLALEIQEGKFPMREKEHCSRLGATAACTTRQMEMVAGCGQSKTEAKSKPDKGLGDSWFGSVTAIVKAAKNGQELIGCVKTNFTKSPKKAMEELMDDCPSGSYYVAVCNVPEEDDIKIIFVSYKYNARKVLHFVMTDGAGSTVPDPNRAYIARFHDEFGNLAARKVPRPECLSDYFEKSNAVDVHNQMRQGILGLEDKWVTQCGFFRIMCTIYGMCVIDTKEAMRHGLARLHPLANASVKHVAGAIADDIFRRMHLTDETHPSHTIPVLRDGHPGIVEVASTRDSDASSVITGTSPMGASIASSATASSCSWIVPMPAVVGAPGVPEWYREKHKQAETIELTENQERKLRKRCDRCQTRGVVYCVQCQRFFCKDGSISRRTKGNTDEPKLRFCMWDHICASFHQSNWAGKVFNEEYTGWLASQE